MTRWLFHQSSSSLSLVSRLTQADHPLLSRLTQADHPLVSRLTQADHPLQLGKRDSVLQNRHHCNITAQDSSSVLKHAGHVNIHTEPLNDLFCVHKHTLQNTFRNQIYVFRPKGNLFHHEDMLHNVCFNLFHHEDMLHNVCFNFQKQCFLLHNFIFICFKKYSPFAQGMCQFKYQSSHLKVMGLAVTSCKQIKWTSIQHKKKPAEVKKHRFNVIYLYYYNYYYYNYLKIKPLRSNQVVLRNIWHYCYNCYLLYYNNKNNYNSNTNKRLLVHDNPTFYLSTSYSTTARQQ